MRSKFVVVALGRRGRRRASRSLALALTGLCLAASYLASAPATATEVYVYRDAQGNRVYSDQRPSVPAERVQIDAGPRNQQNAEDQPSPQAQREALDKVAADRLVRDRAAAEEKAAAEAERDKRCQDARRENARFAFGGRIYEVDGQGNPVYFSSAEIDKRRADAARAMQANCGRK